MTAPLYSVSMKSATCCEESAATSARIAGRVFVARPDGENVGIGIILRALDGEAVVHGVDARIQRIVGVDDGVIHVLQRAGDLPGFHFDETKAVGVVDDVPWGWR